MGIITWIVLGAIAGFLANMLVGGREGLIGTIVLGIVGAVVGGWLAGTFLNLKDPTGINVEASSFPSSAPSSCCSCTGRWRVDAGWFEVAPRIQPLHDDLIVPAYGATNRSDSAMCPSSSRTIWLVSGE
jgi:uncharacterized membrane protein YeaQ/YmgE (transglycosylase-associated protein family)